MATDKRMDLGLQMYNSRKGCLEPSSQFDDVDDERNENQNWHAGGD
jgi:hypothetical protein